MRAIFLAALVFMTLQNAANAANTNLVKMSGGFVYTNAFAVSSRIVTEPVVVGGLYADIATCEAAKDEALSKEFEVYPEINKSLYKQLSKLSIIKCTETGQLVQGSAHRLSGSVILTNATSSETIKKISASIPFDGFYATGALCDAALIDIKNTAPEQLDDFGAPTVLAVGNLQTIPQLSCGQVSSTAQ